MEEDAEETSDLGEVGPLLLRQMLLSLMSVLLLKLVFRLFAALLPHPCICSVADNQL